jgi:hypothetical protein
VRISAGFRIGGIKTGVDAPSWDDCEIRGDLEKHDACAIYRREGRTMAVATIGRDRLSLRVEAALEQGDTAAVESILRDQ